MTPFDIVNIIYNKTEHDREEVLGDYNEWLINHALSNNMDTLLFAQEMSQYNHLPKDIQFDFYQFGIPKGKRYGKWHKMEKSDESLINMLCKTYNCNLVVAKRYLSLLDDEQKQQLLSSEGGNNGRTSNRGGNNS
jgi:hypothetical protein